MTQDQAANGNADLPDLEEFLDGDPLAAEIEALKAERDEFRDKFMRALADAENSRKRADRDRREPSNTAPPASRATCCRFTTT